MTIARLAIVDSTLREGEQFGPAHFSTQDKLRVAALLDAFGADYIEMTSPLASPRSEADLRAVVAMSRRARVLTHTRCVLDDVRRAVDCGVDGVNVLFGTSELLRTHSHGRSVDEIVEQAVEVVSWLRGAGVEARFSCEDSFRTDLSDLLRIYAAVDHCGVGRVGIADTVGVAAPRDVTRVVSAVREAVGCDIEVHLHNDTGCAVANALTALEAGATHIDTTILGIGERNGIVPLTSLVARLMTVAPELLDSLRLDLLPEMDHAVATMVGVAVPFNAPITGPTAFSHKAGIHTKSVLSEPTTYEVLDPARFGLSRQVLSGHQLTGHNVIRHRTQELGLDLDDDQLRALAAEVSRRADTRPLATSELDELLRGWATV